MKPVVLFGTGKIAEVVHYYMAEDGGVEVAAFTCDRDYVTAESFAGRPLVPFDEVQAAYPPADFAFFVALGYQDMNALRTARIAEAKALGYELASFVHPSAGVAKDAKLGEHCFLMDHVFVQPGVTLGDNVFVWSGALVGHHSTVGDNCWVTSTAAICGQVTMGRSCFLGANATVGNGITVGDDCFLGANTLVTKDLADSSVVVQRSSEVLPVNSRQFLRMSTFR